ncbi:hypothetical protein D9601_02345 [Sphingomonas sp. MA1305]|uniref:hypothetical protein n=1 Tax=Sphingomonas sp. MA1305 TaxID=2479204 RepID=UPI0018E05354|nr:hypothetical protein [Sphingomonas sp. MA1305]MBI0474205.1 hypothetical protein [Sphingomonas sp. MA1305]
MIASFILRYVAPPLAFLAVVAWLWTGWSHADARADDLKGQLIDQTARADALQKKVAAMAQADAERALDGDKLDQMKDDLTHAIDAAPKGNAPGPASVAVGCARLRAQGNTASAAYRRVCG